MGLFIGDNAPSKIFIGDSEVSKVFVGDTKVRPSGLPSAYQEVEYIASSGSSVTGQYINTGYSWTTNNGEVKFKYMPLRFGSVYYIDRLGGAYNGNRAFALYTCYSSPYIGLGENDINITGTTISLNTEYDVDVVANNGSGTVAINGTSTSVSYSGTIGNNYNYPIFASHETSGYYEYRCAARLYYFQMYEGGTLVRDFVPCYRISDTEIGLYDLVNDVFYTNAGSGTFSKGSDV